MLQFSFLSKHNWGSKVMSNSECTGLCKGSGAPGLVDRVFTFYVGVAGSITTIGTCLNNSFRSNRPGYPHKVCSELKNKWYQRGGGR